MLTLQYRFVLGLLLILFIQGKALGNDLITNRAYYEDISGGMSYEEVKNVPFHEFHDILSLGYLKASVWVRLRIDPKGASEETPLIIRISPQYLDSIKLFDPLFHSYGKLVTGDEEPILQQNFDSLHLNFVIPTGTVPRDIWLKVRTKSTLLLDAHALPLVEALKEDRVEDLKYSAYLAILLIFVLWGLLYLTNQRDPTIQFFVVTQLLCLIFMAGMLGFYRAFWPISDVITEGTFVDYAVAPYIASSFRLDYLLLREAGPNQRLLKILKLSPIYLVVYLLLMVSGFKQEAFQMSMSVVFIVTFLYLILSLTLPATETLTAGEMPLLSRRTLITLYASIFLGLSLSVLPSLGIYSSSFLVFDGFLLHSLFSGCAFMIVLHMRTRESLKRAIDLKRTYHDAERRAQYELERRQEQSQFLSMLTHELRTSLSVVSMVLGAKEQTPALLSAADKSIREMGDVIERCLNVDKHEAGQIDIDLAICDLENLIREIISCSTQFDRIRLIVNKDASLHTDIFILRLILSNIIDNAIKYSPIYSSIDVTINEELHGADSYSRVEVTNLVGRAGKPDPGKVFQKYYRHPRAHAFTGTGLGLFLSAQLAQRLGGHLEYASTHTHVSFILCLPRSLSH